MSHDNTLFMKSVALGAGYHIKFLNTPKSVSVLIPGEEPLLYRACLETEKLKLLDWFATVEMRLWEAVNAYYQDCRPEKICLITGQTLTDEYAINHVDQAVLSCEFSVEICSQIPSVLDCQCILGYSAGKVVARGFPIVRLRSGCRYSIYIQAYESRPQKRFRDSRLLSRLKVLHE